MSAEQRKPLAEEFPQELLPYFQEMQRVLAVQGYALSVGGISGDRSPLGRVHVLTTDTLRLVVGESVSEANTNPLEISAWEYLGQVQKGLESGELSASGERLKPSAREFLTKLTVLYKWAEEYANKPYDASIGLRWADSEAGKPVGIILKMLEPFVDQNEVEKEWEIATATPEKFEYYYQVLRFEIGDLLRDPFRDDF